MGKMIYAAMIIFLIIAFACQNKLMVEKEYSTTVSGTLTYKGRGVQDASIKAGSFDTTSDVNGNYSISVFHDGSFLFTIDSTLVKYSENISTKAESVTRNIAK